MKVVLVYNIYEMEKLVKLLNEYRAELLNGNIQNKPMRYSYGGYVFGLSDLTEQNCILLIISKSYGFIKWLVDNDKIDFEKYRIMDTRKYLHQHIIGNTCYVDIRADVPNYEFILASLSIRDEPIEFLCSILK